MTFRRFPNRRRVSGFLLALLASMGRGIAAPRPKDQGIGGTGVAPSDPERKSDRGIGGTGVIGTIQDFGSIIVNGLRISYPPDVSVHIDGRQATVAELKRGHVVRTVATGRGDSLSTKRIDVVSEVVGLVERATPQELRVMGQTVSFGGEVDHGWRVGDRVAVSGLRRTDGVIVANLVEQRPIGAASVAGPVRRGAGGRLMIGDLALSGVSDTLVGQRTIVSGTVIGETLQAEASQNERIALGTGIARVSIEAYVVPGPDGLRLGSGLSVSGLRGKVGAGTGGERRIIGATMQRGGNLRADSVKPLPANASFSGNGLRGNSFDPGGAQGGPGRGGADRGEAGGNAPGGAPSGPGGSPSDGLRGGQTGPGGFGSPGGPGGARGGLGGRR